MKYWIFQNNQVLGPYGPDEMEKISVFSPESLVCPEGRRGTSMGDWQRAGMVPDLSVALVRASSSGGKASVLSIAGLPPEPTLKDLAQLGSIQEKVAVLEEVVLQLQEGLRAKDAELSSVHQELAGKSREASEIRSEAVARVRESEELKRQIAGLEERLSSVRQLSETLDKAVEEEKRVESDVEKQGRTLTDLARDVEELRRQLEESKARQAELAAEAAAAATAAAAPPAPAPRAAEFVPPPSMPVPETAPSAPSAPRPEPSMEFPASEAPLPSFDPGVPTTAASAPQDSAPNFDPMAFGDAASGALAPDLTATPAAEPEAYGVDTRAPSPPPPAPKGKKALLIGGVLGIAALGGLAVMGGYVPGLVKPQAPAEVLEPTPLPPPEPPPAPVVAPDPRELAVDFAKAWPLTGGRTLERALEDLAPSAGNLSPWMADPLAGSRVQVNYFARSSAPGAPTIAYEFEVDLEGQTLIGRNAAAKSVLTGKAAPPPAPPKAKPVKVKPKAPVKKKAPEEVTLDSLLGGEEDSLDPPAEESPRPARPSPARRAAKAKAAEAAPADENLLDDLLKE